MEVRIRLDSQALRQFTRPANTHLSVPGHMSVAIIPALLALAEHRHAAGAEFVAAFVAGYELACRVGKLVEPAHYAPGFHATATATIGSLLSLT